MNGEFILQRRGPLYLTVYRGPTQTIENFMKGHEKKTDATLSEPKTVTVCGTKGTMVSADFESYSHPSGHRRPESDASGPEIRSIRTVPANTSVVMGFVHNDVPIMVGYRIETRERAAYEKIEKHYFSSVSCELPGAEKK